MPAAAWVWLRHSLPRVEGEATAKGLGAAVDIVRDREGIPHIFAKDAHDAWFAMGYVHAQDRLWQMEFQRRVGAGRLSEILGERTYEIDRLMRTLGIARAAERIVERLDAGTRANLEAYAAGVNAFLDTDPTLPIEFQALRVHPEHWKPADTMAWLLVMAYDLSGNWRTELARVRLVAALGKKRAEEFMPPYPGDPAWPLPDFKKLYADVDPLARALLAATPGHKEGIGSNNWVVDGTLSETGKPLLANDPHLGLQAPSLWYLAHVSIAGRNVVGGTLPGVPFVVLGHNDDVAWAFTTTNADTQDLFVEREAPGDPDSYLTPTGRAKFEVRDEVIRVGTEERHLRVRATRHGPVISDVVSSAAKATPEGHVLALAWSALSEDNHVARAGFEIDAARGRDDMRAAARDFSAPVQNVVYADREGHIGLIVPGLIPVRRADNEAMGRVPVPGWDAKYDWQGFIPFEELPAVRDPASHMIVTANHKITPAGYKPFITVDWFPPYRADRIAELLAQQPRHSLDSFAKIQADVQSRLARDMLPFALAARPNTPEGAEAQAMLRGWDATMTADSPAPLVFAAWYRELTRLVYADELDELFPEFWEHRPSFMLPVLKDENGMGHWCDSVKTAVVETCAMRTATAFDVAADDLRKLYGAPAKWRWGAAHFAAGDHRPFGFIPWIGSWFNVSPETPGDSYTVDVGHYFIKDEARPFANRHAPSLRALYDLADLERSRFIQSTGQSGNVMSPWYSNMAQRWAKVQSVTIPTKREAIEASHTLTIKP